MEGFRCGGPFDVHASMHTSKKIDMYAQKLPEWYVGRKVHAEGALSEGTEAASFVHAELAEVTCSEALFCRAVLGGLVFIRSSYACVDGERHEIEAAARGSRVVRVEVLDDVTGKWVDRLVTRAESLRVLTAVQASTKNALCAARKRHTEGFFCI